MVAETLMTIVTALFWSSAFLSWPSGAWCVTAVHSSWSSLLCWVHDADGSASNLYVFMPLVRVLVVLGVSDWTYCPDLGVDSIQGVATGLLYCVCCSTYLLQSCFISSMPSFLVMVGQCIGACYGSDTVVGRRSHDQHLQKIFFYVTYCSIFCLHNKWILLRPNIVETSLLMQPGLEDQLNYLFCWINNPYT